MLRAKFLNIESFYKMGYGNNELPATEQAAAVSKETFDY